MAKQSNIPMVSEVSICNQALSWVGQSEITSLDQNNKGAEWCRNNYPFIRDAVLQERTWTFATVRATSTTADLDAWGGMYVHTLEDEWLSVFRVYRASNLAGQMIPDDSWRMEEGKIVSNQSTVYYWGLKQITDTGKFPPVFVQALAARLAAEMAIAITKNRQLQADMWALYGDKLREAAARDGQQGANDVITQTRLVNARYSGGYLIG